MATCKTTDPALAAILGNAPRLAESLFEVLPLGIVVTSAAGGIIEANFAAQSQLGLRRTAPGLSTFAPSTATLIRADGTRLPPDEHPCLRAAREQRVLSDEEIGMVASDGTTTWFHITATPLPGVGVVATYFDATLRRQSDEDLRHHIDQLDAFFETSPDLLAILDTEGRVVRLNPAWHTILGYPLAELEGVRILDLLHPSDVEATLGALARLGGPREVVAFVNRMHHHNGDYQFLEWRATARGDLVYATARDITERHLAEAALRESELRFRAIFEQAAVGVAEIDINSGRFLRANRRLCDMVGYGQEELLGRTFESITHPEDVAGTAVWMQQIQDGSSCVDEHEKRYIHKDGHIVWVSVQVRLLSQSGQPARSRVAIVQDISERKETQEILLRSLSDTLYANQRLNFQITRMPLAYIVWDLDFVVTEWNPSAERIFGYAAAEALGKHAYTLIVPPDVRPLVAKLWHAVIEGGDFASHSINENCTKDGKRIVCEWFNAPWVDVDGKIVGCLSMVHDITARQQLEEKVARAQKMESLGSFAGGVAHDINNVLRVVMDTASSLGTTLHEPDAVVKGAGRILEDCRRGRTLVRGLLDFARQDLPHATPFDLNDVIREQLALIEGVIPPGIRVQIELDPMLDPIRGDARALGSAFVHLCFNALDAMPERGVLTLRTRRLGAAEVELDVDDTGFGMPKAILDKAFEPFFTTKQRGKGTGLGLPVVYGAVKAHQGRVEIHSEPGRGTQVQIVLPVCPDVLDEAESIPEGASSKKRHGLHILLVDDDELVQTAVSSQLRHLGHSVTIAPHGQAALDSLNSGLSVDLVLLDLDMPVLDGRAALPRLRALRPTLPVIIETGKLDDHAEDLAREHPDVSILIKPFSLNELHAAIVPWVKQEAPGAE